jgi:pilus assembly protein CpaD
MQKQQNLCKNTVNFPRFSAVGWAIVATLALSGCTTYKPSFAPSVLRNKVTVTESVERLELYASQAGLQLSARDETAVGAFISQYASSGQGPLYVNVPSNGANSPGVEQAHSILKNYLGRMGLGAANVQTGQYKVAMGALAPVVVSYRRLTTAPIDCSQGASLTHTSNNQAYGNFGCAQTANLAALIDNPMQLLAPYGIDNAYATRRMTVIDKYNAGEVTASESSPTQEVSVSEGGR